MALSNFLFFVSIFCLQSVVEPSSPQVCPIGNVQCAVDNFEYLPPPITYAVPGTNVTIRCVPTFQSSTFILRNVTGPPSCEFQQNVVDCPNTNNICTLDVDSGTLTLFNFQSHYNGTYRFDFPFGLGTFCTVNFQVIEAVPPLLTDNSSRMMTQDFDTGPLTLHPTISYGLPAGVFYWQKNGQNISFSNPLTINKVVADDRGNYTAIISSISGSFHLDYTVFVRFPAEISLFTVPNVTATGNLVTVHCNAIAFPAILTIQLFEVNSDGSKVLVTGDSLMTTIGKELQDTLNYEATLEYSLNSCSPKVYMCEVDNDKYTSSRNIGVCQEVPNILNFMIDRMTSTNITVNLTWTLTPDQVFVTNYIFEYRQQDSSVWTRKSVTNNDGFSETYYVINGLSPGLTYEFRMMARNLIGEGSYTDNELFRVYSAPQTVPKGLTAIRNKTNDTEEIFLTWQAVEDVSYQPFTYYEVIYYSNNTDRTVRPSTNLFFKLSPVNPATTYYFEVRAVTPWGVGDASAVVESQKSVDTDSNIFNDVSVQITVHDGGTAVNIEWNINGVIYVKSVSIVIYRFEDIQLNELTLHKIFEFNVSVSDNEECFARLNSSDVYRFCVIAVLTNTATKFDCQIITTGINVVHINQNECENVTNHFNPPVIETWIIILIVVASVLLVFFLFGGCGLYFGIKHNKKGETDLYSPEPSMEGLSHINSSYPYPTKTKRDSSPSRSCMAYRHNHRHEHGIDWRVTDQRQGITEV